MNNPRLLALACLAGVSLAETNTAFLGTKGVKNDVHGVPLEIAKGLNAPILVPEEDDLLMADDYDDVATATLDPTGSADPTGNPTGILTGVPTPPDLDCLCGQTPGENPTCEIDTDGDGVIDRFESEEDKTNPCAVDLSMFDPLCASGEWYMNDCDADGTPNILEYITGLNLFDSCESYLTYNVTNTDENGKPLPMSDNVTVITFSTTDKIFDGIRELLELKDIVARQYLLFRGTLELSESYQSSYPEFYIRGDTCDPNLRTTLKPSASLVESNVTLPLISIPSKENMAYEWRFEEGRPSWNYQVINIANIDFFGGKINNYGSILEQPLHENTSHTDLEMYLIVENVNIMEWSLGRTQQLQPPPGWAAFPAFKLRNVAEFSVTDLHMLDSPKFAEILRMADSIYIDTDFEGNTLEFPYTSRSAIEWNGFSYYFTDANIPMHNPSAGILDLHDSNEAEMMFVNMNILNAKFNSNIFNIFTTGMSFITVKNATIHGVWYESLFNLSGGDGLFWVEDITINDTLSQYAILNLDNSNTDDEGLGRKRQINLGDAAVEPQHIRVYLKGEISITRTVLQSVLTVTEDPVAERQNVSYNIHVGDGLIIVGVVLLQEEDGDSLFDFNTQNSPLEAHLQGTIRDIDGSESGDYMISPQHPLFHIQSTNEDSFLNLTGLNVVNVSLPPNVNSRNLMSVKVANVEMRDIVFRELTMYGNQSLDGDEAVLRTPLLVNAESVEVSNFQCDSNLLIMLDEIAENSTLSSCFTLNTDAVTFTYANDVPALTHLVSLNESNIGFYAVALTGNSTASWVDQDGATLAQTITNFDLMFSIEDGPPKYPLGTPDCAYRHIVSTNESYGFFPCSYATL